MCHLVAVEVSDCEVIGLLNLGRAWKEDATEFVKRLYLWQCRCPVIRHSECTTGHMMLQKMYQMPRPMHCHTHHRGERRQLRPVLDVIGGRNGRAVKDQREQVGVRLDVLVVDALDGLLCLGAGEVAAVAFVLAPL